MASVQFKENLIYWDKTCQVIAHVIGTIFRPTAMGCSLHTVLYYSDDDIGVPCTTVQNDLNELT